jgi:hypothetical protein
MVSKSQDPFSVFAKAMAEPLVVAVMNVAIGEASLARILPWA